MVNQKHQFFFFCLAVSLLAVLSGCQSSAPIASDKPVASEKQRSPIETKLQQLYTTLDGSNNSEVAAELYSISQQTLSAQETNLLTLTQAKLLFFDGDSAAALSETNRINSDAALEQADNDFLVQLNLLKADILLSLGKPLDAAKKRNSVDHFIEDQQLRVENQQALWQDLALLTRDEVKHAQQTENNKTLQQWLELSLLAHYSELPLDKQIEQINLWQKQHATHPGALVPPFEISATRIAIRKRPKVIAVLLPFEDKYQHIGNAIRDGIMTAYYNSNYRPKIVFYSLAPDQDLLPIYNDLQHDGAELIIGPLFSEQLESLYQYTKLQSTTIALNKTDNNEKPEGLYEFSLSQDDEINSIVKLAKSRGHQQAVILAQDSSWANKASEHFQQQWQAQGGSVLASANFENNKEQSTVIQQAFDIKASKDRINKVKWAIGQVEAEPRRRKDIDMILILSKPTLAASLRPLLSFHYANDIDLFATSSLYRGYPNTRIDNDFNNIQFTDLPLIIEPSQPVSSSYQQSPLIRMYAFGIDAFQLSERIHLMQQLPSIKLYGATGALALNKQQIERDMAFAKFKQGKVTPMTTVNNSQHESE
jgi:outer membrane PBP1 activator LpoA protein